MDSLNSATPEEYRSIARRLRNTWRRSVNEGAGLFVVAMVATTTFAISARLCLPAYNKYLADVTATTTSLVGAELDTTAAQTIRAALALITARLDPAAASDTVGTVGATESADAPMLDCSRNACPSLDEAVALVTRLREDIERVQAECARTAAPKTCATADVAARQDSVSTRLQSDSKQEYEELVWRLADVRTHGAPLSELRLAECAKEGARRVSEAFIAYLPAPLCDADPDPRGTRLIIPQQVSSSDTSQIGLRVKQAVAESEVLRLFVRTLDECNRSPACPLTDAATAVAEDHAVSSTPALRPKLVQAYFISTDSVLRIWSPQSPPDLLPPARLWSQSIYFSQLMHASTRPHPYHRSRLYVDTGGNGLVRTFCIPIESVWRANGVGMASLLGALCLDYGLMGSREAFRSLESRLMTPLTDIAIRSVMVKAAENGATSELVLNGTPIDGVAEDAVRTSIALQHDAVGRQVTPLKVTHDDTTTVLTAVPIARIDANERVIALLVARDVRPPLRVIVLASTALVGLIGMLVTFIMLGASRRSSELHAMLARLRSLPVAVLETDQTHHVLWANDRAVEVLGRELPRFGEPTPPARSRAPADADDGADVGSTTSAVAFDSLFDWDEGAFARREDGELERTSSDRIQEQRRQGQRSTYYVKLAGRNGTWIKVTASPLLSNAAVGGWMPAFGVQLELSKPELDEVLQFAAQRKREEANSADKLSDPPQGAGQTGGPRS